MVPFRLFLSFLLLVTTRAFSAGSIKHVIVLMLENRSFDHFFGFAKDRLNVNGLTGKEFNFVDPEDVNSKRVFVSGNAPYVNECDPDHGTPPTKEKIYNGTMGGFVMYENQKGHAEKDWCNVMQVFTPERIPVLTSLAEEFAIMDNFFCSHPGPTWPNRMFALSATSAGSTETSTWYHNKEGHFFPQKTIFDQVEEANLQWRLYYNDTPWEIFMTSVLEKPHNLKHMTTFFDDAKTGDLPSYAWINPRLAINTTTQQGSNDQHPDHDVALGERLIKDVYEALRASPAWNETLLVITMDEHGGFYDHVNPPGTVNPGDGETSYPDTGYDFTTLGVRIPTVLVSPLITKGTVITDAPKAQKPFDNSHYDLTSIMSTARILLGMPTTNLTARDGWSATFEHAMSEATPRTDCPLHLPDAPSPALKAEDEAALPLNELQKDIAMVHAFLGVSAEEKAVGAARLRKKKKEVQEMTQGEISEWVHEAFLSWSLQQQQMLK